MMWKEYHNEFDFQFLNIYLHSSRYTDIYIRFMGIICIYGNKMAADHELNVTISFEPSTTNRCVTLKEIFHKFGSNKIRTGFFRKSLNFHELVI